jgi:P27 family predicted phage terminase small subunit
MAQKGRKPKPAMVHLLNGNPSKSSISKRFEKETDASEVRVMHIPDPPEWFDSVAKKEWERVARILIDIRILTEADLSLLEMYCQSYSRWKEAELKLNEVGSTVMEIETKNGGFYLQQRPEVSIAQKYQKLCTGIMSELGLTPSARARGVKQENEDHITPESKQFKDLI